MRAQSTIAEYNITVGAQACIEYIVGRTGDQPREPCQTNSSLSSESCLKKNIPWSQIHTPLYQIVSQFGQDSVQYVANTDFLQFHWDGTPASAS